MYTRTELLKFKNIFQAGLELANTLLQDDAAGSNTSAAPKGNPKKPLSDEEIVRRISKRNLRVKK